MHSLRADLGGALQALRQLLERCLSWSGSGRGGGARQLTAGLSWLAAAGDVQAREQALQAVSGPQ